MEYIRNLSQKGYCFNSLISGMSFQFKQFKINHHPEVFKFGTDAALLATWANIANSKNILEIGTGCGVISFIMGQRNPLAKYIGIDISSDAIKLAQQNLDHYPIPTQIEFIHTKLQNFATSIKFDHIISNPPFFEKSTKSPSSLKNTTRHTDTLPLQDLLQESKKLLTINGKISIIYPVRYLNDIYSVCKKIQLYPQRVYLTRSKPEREIKRVLVELGLTPNTNPKQIELIIEGTHKGYSKRVYDMFQPFYLKL